MLLITVFSTGCKKEEVKPKVYNRQISILDFEQDKNSIVNEIIKCKIKNTGDETIYYYLIQ
jgi:hypothetical protein